MHDLLRSGGEVYVDGVYDWDLYAFMQENIILWVRGLDGFWRWALKMGGW